MEGVSFLQSSPSKPTMVGEVCCHCHELLIAVKVWCFHSDFFFWLLFISLISFLFSVFSFLFFSGFFNTVFLAFQKI
jgi:hypothetical protein